LTFAYSVVVLEYSLRTITSGKRLNNVKHLLIAHSAQEVRKLLLSI